MSARIWVLGSMLLPFTAETWQGACIAFDSANKTAYISDVLERECATQAACVAELKDKWSAFLKKEGLAQTAGATTRCEAYKDGSNPDELPRTRVRRWRDEEIAQADAGSGKYTKVVQTAFEMH
jgi:hypothetical protein